jgi:GTP-binding protein Era
MNHELDPAAVLPHENYRCGTVALAGRPNVGKSTLLNALIGFRLSIISPRPQTTRHRILGINTTEAGQIMYVDTPGLHRGAKRAMNRSLNRAARTAMAEVDLAVQLIEAGRWTDEDEALYAALVEQNVPRLLAINKVDLAKDKGTLLPFVADLAAHHQFEDIHYVSALKQTGLKELARAILDRLPVRPPVFGADEITDRSERFLAAEMVREQLMAVGSGARRAMEKLFGRRVFLRLWVKVREGWVDDETALKRFGYTD